MTPEHLAAAMKLDIGEGTVSVPIVKLLDVLKKAAGQTEQAPTNHIVTLAEFDGV
eukprot:CAMPEP_0114567698 /NCGR_PEP_ID=MMETSP0114-20121206/15626_1 /TAXON_ID=31324 /ORGANISM="Goniomonas sp, Strain m" /LENGTH=54 /DNA_ID=CAMNT_0001754317 /DNA_START=29 /DNA_END=189 /DNA_ORIENTATION=+